MKCRNPTTGRFGAPSYAGGVHAWLFVLVLTLAGASVVGALVLLIRDRLAGDPYFGLLILLELALLVQAVLGVVGLSEAGADVSRITFVSYLVTLPLLLPLGAFWSLAERTRAGTAVLLVSALTVAGLEVRLDAIWSVGG